MSERRGSRLFSPFLLLTVSLCHVDAQSARAPADPIIESLRASYLQAQRENREFRAEDAWLPKEWEEIVWRHLEAVVRRSFWDEKKEREFQIVRSPEVIEKRQAAVKARQELAEILEVLLNTRPKETASLIAPLLSAKGLAIWNGDAVSAAVQDDALGAMTALLLSNYSLKGNPPGGEAARAFKASVEAVDRVEGITVPKISGSLEDWRSWWKTASTLHGGRFSLVPDLQSSKEP